MMLNIGLIVEGGGMRGAYTAGVLECFLEQSLTFPYAIGVSAGANTLCSYLSRQTLRNKRLYTEWITDKRFINWRNLFKEGAYFGMDFLFNQLPTTLDPFDFESFKKSPTCFKVGVTNCLTGQCDYLEPKLASTLKETNQILQASSSLPFISKIVYLQGTPYLDGGISDSIPIRQAESEGYTHNIVILTRNANYRKTPSKKTSVIAHHTFKNYPHLAEAISKRYMIYNETLDYLNSLEKQNKVFILRPKLPLQVDRFEKNRTKLNALYEQGYKQAQESLPKLLEWIHSTL